MHAECHTLPDMMARTGARNDGHLKKSPQRCATDRAHRVWTTSDTGTDEKCHRHTARRSSWLHRITRLRLV